MYFLNVMNDSSLMLNWVARVFLGFYVLFHSILSVRSSSSGHMVSDIHTKLTDSHKSKINTQHYFNYDSYRFYIPAAFCLGLIRSIPNGTLQNEVQKVLLACRKRGSQSVLALSVLSPACLIFINST